MEKEKLYEILNNNVFDTNELALQKGISTDQKIFKRLRSLDLKIKRLFAILELALVNGH